MKPNILCLEACVPLFQKENGMRSSSAQLLNFTFDYFLRICQWLKGSHRPGCWWHFFFIMMAASQLCYHIGELWYCLGECIWQADYCVNLWCAFLLGFTIGILWAEIFTDGIFFQILRKNWRELWILINWLSIQKYLIWFTKRE